MPACWDGRAPPDALVDLLGSPTAGRDRGPAGSYGSDGIFTIFAGMPLLERDAAEAALGEYLNDALAGRGRCLFVSGEAGVGKTLLIQHFQASTSVRAVWGYCDGVATPGPFRPIRDLIRPLGGSVAEALGHGSRHDLAAALLDGADRSGVRMVVLEDLHWADQATLDLIVSLGRRVTDHPLLVVATFRDDELGPLHPLRSTLGRLATASSVRRIAIGPLSVDGVRELLGSTELDPVEIHRQTGGNPFLVTQMASSSSGRIPVRVEEWTVARLSPLSRAAVDALIAAALIGDRTEVDLLADVTPLTGDTRQEVASSGIVSFAEDRVIFQHELVRRVLEEKVATAGAASLHATILAALESRQGVEIARLAHHATAAGDAERAVAFAEEAARISAAAGSHREAAVQWGRVLRFPAAVTPAQRALFLEQRAYELYLTDALREAVATQAAALDAWRVIGDRLRVGNCLRALSRFAWYSGDRDRAVSAADDAIAELESLGVSPELALAYSNRAQLLMLESRFSRALEWGRRAIDLAEAVGDDETLVHALNNVGTSLAGSEPGAGYEQLRRSLDIALDKNLEEHVARAYTNLGCLALFNRDYQTSRSNFQAGIGYCRERDLDSWLLYMTAMQARLFLEQGEWEEALRAANWLLSHRRVETSITRSIALTIAGLIGARRGEPDQASLDEALDLVRPTGEADRTGYVRAARAEIAWLSGDFETGLREAKAGFDETLGVESVSIRALTALWVARVGGDVASVDVPEPARSEISGDLRAATLKWERMGCVYDDALCLGRLPEPEAAARAGTLLRDLGASATIKALNRYRRAARLPLIPRGPSARTRRNPAGLTERELDVLALLHEGLRNAEIAARLVVSEKTVDHHVSSVLRKLGVRSRAAAAIQAPRLISSLSPRVGTERSNREAGPAEPS